MVVNRRSSKRPRHHPRTLYRFIDQGDIPYRFGRVIRLKADEVDGFIENCKIQPGTLEHLYPEPTTPSGDKAGRQVSVDMGDHTSAVGNLASLAAFTRSTM